MTKERSIEVKVGLLVLGALILLSGFVFIFAGINLEKTYEVSVDFNNPGGLQPGAGVRIAGVKVGTVKALEFRAGKKDDATGRQSLVRAKVAIEAKLQPTIHEDADFYVTTQGVLGEQFLAIDPGSPEKAPLREGAVVKGIDPPRIDLFLAKAYELLDTTVSGLRNNRDLIAQMANDSSGVLKGLNVLVNQNRDSVTRTMANVEALSAEAKDAVKDARASYIDNPKIKQAIDTAALASTELHDALGPMLKDGREALANVNRASALVGSPEEQAKLKKILADMGDLTSHANAATADALAIVAQIKKGKGSVGGLVMDEELYDNLQEMVRDLKHNPWKFLWKE